MLHSWPYFHIMHPSVFVVILSLKFCAAIRIVFPTTFLVFVILFIKYSAAHSHPKSNTMKQTPSIGTTRIPGIATSQLVFRLSLPPHFAPRYSVVYYVSTGCGEAELKALQLGDQERYGNFFEIIGEYGFRLPPT